LTRRFERAVESRGATVESLEFSQRSGDSLVDLRYSADVETEEDVGQSIGLIAGIYGEAVDDGWSHDRLEANLVTESNERVATYTVQTDWAQQWANDELTDDQYVRRVVETARLSGSLTTATAE
jgi:hypothetical protein